MGLSIAITAGVLISLGLVLTTGGLIRRERPVSPSFSTPLWKRYGPLWRGLSRRRQAWVVGSVAAGVLAAVVTGWLLAAVVVPLFALGIPALLSAPPNREVEMLAALDRWVRLLAPAIGVGKSIRDAISSTRTQVPRELADPVARLTARMDQGWSTRDALLAMADELGLSDSDAVLAALAIASSRGGVGTRATLAALSDTIQHRLRVLREIASERAKPRAVVRQVTLVTLAVLGGSLLVGGNFFEPYQSALGQVLALTLAAAYLGCLVMLRRRTNPVPAARFLRAQS